MSGTVAVLGVGAMGSRVARRLLAGGLGVSVYNRSPDATVALQSQGARVATTPREAAGGADVVVAMVTDDDASRAVWEGEEGALEGLVPGAVAVESSTLTPTRIRELAARAQARGASFLDAPVVGSRPQAEAGQLVYLVGGDEATLARVRPVLDLAGSAVHHVGEVGQGTAMKLAVNALFAVQVAALGELLGFLRRSGVDEARAAEVLGALPVLSPAAKGALASMAARNFAPLFPVALVTKDLRYILEAATTGEAELPLSQAAREVFGRAEAAGYGHEHLAAVARLFGGHGPTRSP
ncbi:3-hydroxyisobutyrate dehydrogenase (plasmid) [Deinococcus aetherius]|uniref:3-hydroxyisobutyrate dehydrogenase n=1 Tax=Deinococcus aetherius TaxID=200252 RepID=A0ABN6RKI7_9DEIO|nr:NAD(P)-dependent oxidoreductase [Deinococcus aetherius]BDP43850.1 3-hydroxyisobutyrate dehydrogenase [Deinococcus aetherius]